MHFLYVNQSCSTSITWFHIHNQFYGYGKMSNANQTTADKNTV